MILDPRYLEFLDKIAKHLSEHGDFSPLAQMLKLQEETGEASAALIGALGFNSRKGFTHGIDDVVDELVDVAVTALLNVICLGRDLEVSLQRNFEKVQRRMLDEETWRMK